MLNGYVLMGMSENTKYKGRNVFYFVNSVQLDQSIQEYLNKA